MPLTGQEQAIVDVVHQVLAKTDLPPFDANVEDKFGDALRRSWLALYREHAAQVEMLAATQQEVPMLCDMVGGVTPCSDCPQTLSCHDVSEHKEEASDAE